MSEPRATSLLLSDCGLVIDLDIDRYCTEPSPGERRFLKRLRGPILDVGCGPGRAAAFLRNHGTAALGVDVRADLVNLARRNGALCVRQNIFETVPFEGRWQEVLLLDGNIGIGGEPDKMLERLRRVVRPGGTAYIEVSPIGPTRQLVVREHHAGVTGKPFAWAVVSMAGLDELLVGSGWRCHHVHAIRERVAVELWRSSARHERLIVELERT